ncbi:hypothetical protein [Peribacillus sp. SCS-155]|uniref:hypothetical protein n=1 Tax=Peribacillus sedimenti TaxID=3115297 RepID=UPI003905E5A7
MTEQEVNEILDKLASREIEAHLVEKHEFLAFRNVLVKREDFKHFRGIAQHGGNVLYQYLDEARS